MVMSCARPCWSETKLPERSSVHFTGRPSTRARVQDADVFRIDRGLHAERAADLAGDDAHLVGRRAEDVHQRGLHAEHALAATNAASILRRGVVLADRRARLHRRHDHALIGGLQPRDVLGLGEGLGDFLGVAVVEVERDIVRHRVEDQRRARASTASRRLAAPPAAARCRARPLRRRLWPAPRFPPPRRRPDRRRSAPCRRPAPAAACNGSASRRGSSAAGRI